jgi:hypothetical protein
MAYVFAENGLRYGGATTGGSSLEGSGSEQLLVARIGTSVEVKGFI